MEKVRVEPADFEEFRKFHEKVNTDYRVWLTLKPAQDAAAAPALEALLAWAPEDAVSAGTLARIYEQNNQPAEARRVLRRALHYHPDDQTMLELAVKAADAPEEEEAAQRELVKRFPDEPKYVLALGAILVQHNQHDKARAVLEPLAKKGAAADKAEAHYQLARSFYKKDDPENALKHLDAAEKLDAETVNTVRAHLLRGLVEEDLKRPEEAASAYQLALALDHDSLEALDALVRLSLDAGKSDEALGFLRRYVVVVGDDFEGLLSGADYALRLQRWDDAFELASRAADLKFHERAHRIIGLVYLHRGDPIKAVEHLEKAEADDIVLEALIRAQLELGNLREAAFRLDQAGKIDKPSQELRDACDRSRRLMTRRSELEKQLKAPVGKEGDWAVALDLVVCAEEALENDQAGTADQLLGSIFTKGLEFGPAFGLRARLNLGKGRLSAALADAERAIRLTPREAAGFYVRGRVHLERNDLPGGLADLEKAAELTKRQNADVLHGLADALYRSGKVDDALAAQRVAVKLKPKNKEMAEQLNAFEKAARPEGGTK
jgi:tetratricopeptide (TPR) repeat protein